ncbi:MAG: hypothetical protein QM774_00290 [Gordonia sp. (in: high G+C Gram-positive bacteria)]|uniref:hypothetical protein n=1 Tax=Gordonia sp. (in: high G+C Gram-positive bacteria) TaxID=84139 RepID=UPI0039E3291A
MDFTVAAQIGLIAAGLIFLWALLLGIWKYAGMVRSPDGQAHVYVDVAHRSALMYSFAAALLAVFAQFNRFPSWLTAPAISVVLAFFVSAIASYCWHGWRRDTDNQMHPATASMTASMVALIVGEVGGTAILFAGFVAELARS